MTLTPLATGKTGIMIDIESLDLGPRSVILQIGIIAYPLDDPATEGRRIDTYLPAQPQMALGRTISFRTIVWWMDQEDASRKRLVESNGEDMEELLALVRSVHRKLTEVIQSAGGHDNVEVWAKGPQFDIVNVETLFVDCGLTAPWRYDSVMDLRTVMKLAGVKTGDVDATGLTPHVAIDDCRLQMRSYAEAVKQLHSSH